MVIFYPALCVISDTDVSQLGKVLLTAAQKITSSERFGGRILNLTAAWDSHAIFSLQNNRITRRGLCVIQHAETPRASLMKWKAVAVTQH